MRKSSLFFKNGIWGYSVRVLPNNSGLVKSEKNSRLRWLDSFREKFPKVIITINGENHIVGVVKKEELGSITRFTVV